MNDQEVMIARIYLTEEQGQVSGLLKQLHDKEKVRGVTVFRGISGYGDSGVLHDAKFTDLSLNLPIVVEFFDVPAKVEEVLRHLNPVVKPGHLIKWRASVTEALE